MWVTADWLRDITAVCSTVSHAYPNLFFWHPTHKKKKKNEDQDQKFIRFLNDRNHFWRKIWLEFFELFYVQLF